MFACPLLQVSSKEVIWSNGSWISAQHAIFPDTSSSSNDLLTAALLSNGVPLVTDMPTHVAKGFQLYSGSITTLTSQIARSFLSRPDHKVCLTAGPGSFH